MDFAKLVPQIRDKKGLPKFDPEATVLCFDPGHTTGWAAFVGLNLEDQGQIDTTSIPHCAAENVTTLFNLWLPDIVVMEDYRVYKWLTDQHAGSDMLTTRVIGCIETIAWQHFIFDIVKQPAHIAKKWMTDKKLKTWKFYQPGQRHARDAVRHGCYYLMFGPIRKEDKPTGATG